LRAQIDTLPMNEIGALRIGALVGAENIRVVAGFIGAYPATPAVVDPVCSPTLGGAFIDAAALPVLRDLGSLPSVILTPNLEEAARLLDVEQIDAGALGDAALRLRERGALAVLVKGGHLAGDPVDALAFSGGVDVFKDKRLPTTMRGTGCVLAMALACELARGQQLRAAVLAAREFTRKRIATAERFAGLRTAY
jgi:hydroxymethylpyrimidine/phosphomethylpyrimidine kinase